MTNNKQETAVEWLAEKTFNQIELLKHSCINEEQFLNNMLIFREQAKEMDKEQKRKDCNYWEQMGVLKALKVPNRKTFEQYYTETYKQ